MVEDDPIITKHQAAILSGFGYKVILVESGEGTGLGLATVYGIVKQNNGFINVSSKPGEGTTFEIFFPRFGEAVAGGLAENAKATLQKGTETVLLVEDKAAVLKVGKRILEMLGYKVLPASTPEEAIQHAQGYDGEIHLLISDVVMPKMNGRELADKLLTLRPGLKCLFMSGYTADVITHRGVLDGNVNFIQKPYSPNALGDKIREVMKD